MPVEMQLSRIIISEIHDQQIIYLREVEGDRQFPIVIGIFEATSIDRRVKGYQTPRPLTHDLIVKVVEQLDGELDSVVISGLREGTYFAVLRVQAIQAADGDLGGLGQLRLLDVLAVFHHFPGFQSQERLRFLALVP